MDTDKNLSGLTITLHWLVGLAILGLCALGIYMVRTESWDLYHIHKSIGLLALVLIVIRLAWRIRNGLPKPAGQYSQLEHRASKSVHWLLLLGTLALPLTGMVYSGASGHGLGIFSLNLFPANYVAGQAIPFHAALSDLGQAMHSYLGYTLLGLVALHVAGALKHHVVDRDMTLARMLGRRAK